MPRTLYCWRCRIELPMLDEQEWQQVEPHLSNALREVQEYRATHGVSLKAARDAALGKGALRAYHDLTGFRNST